MLCSAAILVGLLHAAPAAKDYDQYRRQQIEKAYREFADAERRSALQRERRRAGLDRDPGGKPTPATDKQRQPRR